MNRAYIRQICKKKLNPKALEDLLKSEGIIATDMAFEAMIIIFANVLNDKLMLHDDLGIVVLQEVADKFESLNRGDITVEDLKEIMETEAGIEMVSKDGVTKFRKKETADDKI